MDKVRSVKLDDVAELSGGFAFKSEQYVDRGRFVLRTVNIKDDASITREGAVFIAEDEAHDFDRFALQEHDTLFVMVAATLGKIGYVRKRDLPALLNQNMWVIRAKPGQVDPVYLHYQFRELSKIPLAWVTGSARSFLRRDDVRNLEFLLPEPSIQVSIGELLKALDDKIELNRRMNETLEQMAQAIFKDWFVDFGPVRRKQDGARDPIAIMGGLVQDATRAAELAALFPDAIGEDGLPEGWKQQPIREVFEINPREILKKGSIAPYSDMASLPTNGPTANPPIMREFSSGMRFRKGDALLARITPCLENGKSAYVDFLEKGVVGWGSTEFIVLRARPPVPKPMSYLLIRQDDFRKHAIRSMTGTSGRQRATETAIGDFLLAVADGAIYRKFGELIEPLFALIHSNAVDNETLAETRDYLLPKLMSGEIRVTETL